MAPIARFASARMFTTAARLNAAAAGKAHFHLFSMPTIAKPAPADWGRVGRRELKTMSIYAPLMFFFLGWPVALESVLDGHI